MFQNLIKIFEQMQSNIKGSILIISHQERIIRLADEIVMIANGQVSARGSVDEIFPLILKDTVGVCTAAEKEGL